MWKILLKTAISIAIFTLIFHQIPIQQLTPYFSKINFWYFALALSLQLFAYAIGALRWALIMDSLHYVASKAFYLKQTLIGAMFNQILPTSIGGDAYKIVAINKLHSGKKMASIAVIIDRLYGLAGLVMINLISLPLIYHLLPKSLFLLILAINLSFFAGLVVLISFSLLRISFKHFSLRIISEISHLIHSTVNSKKDFLVKAVLAALPNLLTIYVFLLIAHSAHITTSFSSLVVIIPSTLLLSMLPISLGGWGLREGALVSLGILIGLSKAESLAISLLFGFNCLLTAIPGVFLYLLEPKSERKNER